MKYSPITISLICLLSAGCSNLYRGIYEGNKNVNEADKSPNERVMTPTPGYDRYQREREELKQTDPATDNNDSPDFNLK